MAPQTDPASAGVFGASRLYDRAFSYRDYGVEVTHLAAHAQAQLHRAPGSCLELAAGPAHHAIEFAKRKVRATALDLSPAMAVQAKAVAADAGVSLATLTADMRAFELEGPVDLAFTLLSSLSHVHTLDDLIAHFSAVRACLSPGGLYVVELQHPRDFLGRGSRTTGVSDPWRIEDADGVLQARWGTKDDPYDPIAQLFEAHVLLKAEGPGGAEQLEDVVTMRDWTRDEIVAAGRLAGLRGIRLFGDLDPSVPFNNAPSAWRMVCVLSEVAQ